MLHDGNSMKVLELLDSTIGGVREAELSYPGRIIVKPVGGNNNGKQTR